MPRYVGHSQGQAPCIRMFDGKGAAGKGEPASEQIGADVFV